MMKTFVMAAGALLISTSALAYDGGKKMDSELAAKSVKIETSGQEAKIVPASAVSWNEPALQPERGASWAEAVHHVQLLNDAPLSADTAEGDPDLDLAVNPDDVDQSAVAHRYQGVGGPEEPIDGDSADLAPRPAAGNYPACRPGPGDDNCIQLYEPGVRENLAAWTQPTGGLAGEEIQTADAGAVDEVMAADDTVDVEPAFAYLDDKPDSVRDDDGVIIA